MSELESDVFAERLRGNVRAALNRDIEVAAQQLFDSVKGYTQTDSDGLSLYIYSENARASVEIIRAACLALGAK